MKCHTAVLTIEQMSLHANQAAESQRMFVYIPFISPLRYTHTYRSSAQTRSKRRMLHANLHDTSPDGGSERLCFKLLDVLNSVARLHHLLFELQVLHIL